MADFNRGRSGGGNFKRRFNDHRPTMHQAVCDKCRQNCEVPFRPTSGKPVYCKSCFDRPTAPAPRSQYEEQFALLNSKMDKILNILMPAASEKK